MGLKERSEIIKEIESQRNSRVVTYFNSDRVGQPPGFYLPGLSTVLSSEATYFIYEQLRLIGKTENLDLFLYTRGGDVDSVWPLVNLCKEYAQKKLAVLLPFRAHSGGTMICLGADEIVMCECAELSPVDPTTGNQFNPIDELTKQRRGISVEDVISYIELAESPSKKPEVDQSDQNVRVLGAFKRLSETVDPVALGNVNRAYTQIRFLAGNLLRLAPRDITDSKIDDAVDYLTKNLYSHSHAINRKEARSILGGQVKDATDSEQRLLWALYEDYAKTLRLNEPLCQDSVIQEAKSDPAMTLNGAFIETESRSIAFKSRFIVELTQQIPPNIQVQVPPGQPMPLIVGLPISVQIKLMEMGWQVNKRRRTR
jgi:hypothetical protein